MGIISRIGMDRRAEMFNQVEWLFFDIGSTLVDEHAAYTHRLRDIASLAHVSYEAVYETAIGFYKQNQKGDSEAAKHFAVPMPKWHTEDEVLYEDTAVCLEMLSKRYQIGIIANQAPGSRDRLKQHGILQYIDLVIASAEEGVAKPDKRIFEIALERSKCTPERAVMIGDRIDNDIVPAKSLGMHTIWIKQGFGQYWDISGETERPDQTVNCLWELCDIL